MSISLSIVTCLNAVPPCIHRLGSVPRILSLLWSDVQWSTALICSRSSVKFSWPEGNMMSPGQLRRREREALGRGRVGANGLQVFFFFNFSHCSLGINPSYHSYSPPHPLTTPPHPLFRVTKASLGESTKTCVPS